MKALLVIIAIVVVLALIGWITFGTGDNSASLTIETDKVKQDTREALREGSELIEGARREIREELREDEAEEAPAADPRRETEIERERPEPVREGTSWTPGSPTRRLESLRV